MDVGDGLLVLCEEAHPEQLQLRYVREAVVVDRAVHRLVHLALDRAAVLPELARSLARGHGEERVLRVPREGLFIRHAELLVEFWDALLDQVVLEREG